MYYDCQWQSGGQAPGHTHCIYFGISGVSAFKYTCALQGTSCQRGHDGSRPLQAHLRLCEKPALG